MARREFRPNEVSAGGVVVRAERGVREVCLVCDGRHWGLPKGIVERGERPEDAALREICEETGLASEGLRIIATLQGSEYVYRSRSGRLIFKRVHLFLVAATGDTRLHPQADELTDAQWLDVASAVDRASFDDTRRAIAEAEGLLGGGEAATAT